MWEQIVAWCREMWPVGVEKFTAALAFIAGIIGAAVGEHANLFIWLTTFCAADFLVGLLAAAINENISSKRMYVGLMKKSSIIGVCFLFHGIGQLIGWNGLCAWVIAAFSINELISVLENLEKAGFGGIIPAPVRNLLESVQKNQEAIIKSKFPGGTK